MGFEQRPDTPDPLREGVVSYWVPNRTPGHVELIADAPTRREELR
jgi:hypothetical protein